MIIVPVEKCLDHWNCGSPSGASCNGRVAEDWKVLKDPVRDEHEVLGTPVMDGPAFGIFVVVVIAIVIVVAVVVIIIVVVVIVFGVSHGFGSQMNILGAIGHDDGVVLSKVYLFVELDTAEHVGFLPVLLHAVLKFLAGAPESFVKIPAAYVEHLLLFFARLRVPARTSAHELDQQSILVGKFLGRFRKIETKGGSVAADWIVFVCICVFVRISFIVASEIALGTNLVELIGIEHVQRLSRTDRVGFVVGIRIP
mmetsp:Transcript_24029/g.50725  ORF Transcript_24029/g.50725 Transcript_24029/m.50725 type:complete len:254 (-) Transcript_24029:8-769(-)